MNRGLKSYTKQLTQNIGPCRVSVNINPTDANMHFVAPLVETVGLNPFSASLIFSYADREESGIFGKGVKLNYYAKATKNVSDVTIKNADGSTDTYLASKEYFNAETQLTAQQVTEDYGLNPHIEVTDKLNNKQIYGSLSEYPEKIVAKNGETLTLDFVSSNKTISNQHDDKIVFELVAGKVNKVKYLHENTVCSTVVLSYSNDRISCISYYNKESSADTLMNKTTIAYSESIIIITDFNSGYKITYALQNGKVVSIQDAYRVTNIGARTTTITYQTNKTTITNWQGKKTISYFDSDGLPLYDLDDEGNFVKTEFDGETKMLMAQSNSIWAKDNSAHVYAMTLSDPDNDSLDITSATLQDDDLQGIVSETFKKISLKSGKTHGSVVQKQTLPLVAGESVTAVLWCKQLAAFTDDDYVEISLFANSQSRRAKLKKKVVDNNYEVVVLSLTPRQNIDSVTLNVTINGNASAEIGGIKLFKINGGVYREVEDGNTTAVSNGYATSNFQYSSNLPSKVTQADSSSYETEYNEKNAPVKTMTPDGVVTETVYDTEHPTNIVKQTVTSADKQRVLETSRQYTSDGRFVRSVTDELGTCTESYEYDVQGNLTKVTNALSAVTELTYTECGELKKLLLEKGEDSVSADYQYDASHRLQSITLVNGSMYTFAYDACGRISTICLNGQVAFAYTYDNQTGNVLRQQYGENGDGYAFEYNADNLVSKIYYFEANSQPEDANALQLCFTYAYDEQKRLSSVSDQTGVLKTYTYDAQGNVEKVSCRISEDESQGTTERATVSYRKNGLGNANSSIQEIDGKLLCQAQESLARSKTTDPQYIISSFGQSACVGMFTENTKLIGGNLEIAPATNTALSVMRDEGVPCVNLNPGVGLGYIVPYSYPTSGECGCVQFWFKTENVNSKQYLLGVCKSYDSSYIAVYMNQGKLYLTTKVDEGYELPMLTSDYNVLPDKWNFMALNFIQRDDGEGYQKVTEFTLTLNEHTQTYKKMDPQFNISLSVSSIFYIGRNYVGSSNEALYGKIACVFIGKHWYEPLSNIRAYYRATKDFLESCRYINQTSKICDTSQTVAFMPSEATTEKFSIFPLHCDVVSLDGTKYPDKFTMRTGADADRDKVFNYNAKAKRYAYVADGSELVYDFGQDNTGTVVMRAYTDAVCDKQYLLQGKDDDGHTLSLYRKSDMKLYAEYNGSEISTGLTLSSNCWHTVGLSFDIIIIPPLNPFPPNKGGQITIQPPNEAHLTIFVDDACYNKTILTEVSALQNMKFSIGRMFDELQTATSFGDIKESYPLYGQIEMVAASSELCTSATLLQLEDDLNCMSKTNEYDDLGMLKNTYVYDKNDSRVMTLTRNYQARTNDSMRISQRINMDTFAFGDESYWVRQYQYDAMGNVTKIYGETPDCHDYTYDYRNFLVNDNGTAYEYDGNGNITKKGTTTYTYDTVIKDRLVKVGNTPVTYSTANPLNPATYGNCSYNFKGRRLQSFTKSGSTYNYIYDEQGLRTRKIAPDGSVTKYLYNGTKLAAEIAPNYRLDFLYDENDMLYGFVKDGSAKYFYARDMLQNILGIIDTNGSPVVIYQYTAYGTSTVLQDTAGLAIINPFRFKGYYFDSESGMYYCHTRYYVPEWCRWLNADHPSFLQPESLQEMNLFVYCGNNPVMCSDGSGHFPILISVLIGLGIGLATEFFGDLIDDGKINRGWQDYLGAGIAGLIGGLGTGLISTMIFSGIGDVIGGLINGSVTNVEQAVGVFALSAIFAGVGYGIAKGIQHGAAKAKYKKIIGTSKSNSKINKKLGQAGLKGVKIGRDGLETVLEAIKKQYYRYVDDGVNALYSFIYGSVCSFYEF